MQQLNKDFHIQGPFGIRTQCKQKLQEGRISITVCVSSYAYMLVLVV
jgi:hypothetical protein